MELVFFVFISPLVNSTSILPPPRPQNNSLEPPLSPPSAHPPTLKLSHPTSLPQPSSVHPTSTPASLQTNWNLSGRVTADQTITLPEQVLKHIRNDNGKLILQWDAMRCPAMNITVNEGSMHTILWGAHQLDLTDEIVGEQVQLQIELLTSGRNTFGPHHHLKGEVTFVGPTSFTDKIGWVDAGSDKIWTDRYCLVSCGLTGVQLLLVNAS